MTSRTLTTPQVETNPAPARKTSRLVAWIAAGAAVALAAAPRITAQQPAGPRVIHTDPSTYRPLTAVHGGAGSMAYAGLLNRGAIGPHFNFLHRGEIPVGSGIGHHFHNTADEMFIVLNGEAQFTIDGRTAVLKGPVGVVCRAGHSHAIYNSGKEPLQWINFQVSVTAGISDAFDLGDDRSTGVTLDRVPTFMTVSLDPAVTRASGARGRGAAATGPPPAVISRRGFGPSVFASTWAYVDHVIVAPGGQTPALAHAAIGEAYYVLAGQGTVTVGEETSAVKKWDAVPVRLGETSQFTNTGSEPLELLVYGVAKDMESKTAMMMPQMPAGRGRQ
jgi:mannose-6-phosphate isomerase-like protein (cupin superfamily)